MSFFHQFSFCYFVTIFDFFSAAIYYFHDYFATWDKYISCCGGFAILRDARLHTIASPWTSSCWANAAATLDSSRKHYFSTINIAKRRIPLGNLWHISTWVSRIPPLVIRLSKCRNIKCRNISK